MKQTLLLVSFFIFVNFIHAQWQSLNGPKHEAISCVTAIDSNVFAGACYSGVFASYDKGKHWINKNNGIPTNTNLYWPTIIAVDSTLFLGTVEHGIFKSENKADTWEPIHNGLPAHVDFGGDTSYPRIFDFILSGQNLIAATNAGVSYSNNMGQNWFSANGFLFNYPVYNLTKNDSVLYALASNGIYKSTNDGLSWTWLSNKPGIDGYLISSNSTSLFVQSDTNKIFRSDDNGLTWQQLNTGIPNQTEYALVNSIDCNGSEIYVGTFNYGLLYSSDNGDTWSTLNNGLTQAGVTCLFMQGSEFYAGSGIGVFYSPDMGATWECSNEGFENFADLYKVCVQGDNIYVLGSGGMTYSENKGNSWKPIPAGPFTGFIGSGGFYDMAMIGNSVILACPGAGLFFSTDSGKTWQLRNNGLPCPGAMQIAVSGTDIIITNDTCGIFLSQDTGLTWTSIQNGLPSYSIPFLLAASDSIIYFQFDYNHKLYESRDRGINWTYSVFPVDVVDIVFSGSNIMQLLRGTSVRISHDYGHTWSVMLSGLYYDNVDNFYDFHTGLISGNNFYIGTYDHGVYTLCDSTWVPINSGLTLNGNIMDMAIQDSILFVAKFYNGLWRRNVENINIKSFSGNIYSDINNNGIKDSTDVNLENIIVNMTNSGNYYTTNASGNYKAYTEHYVDTIMAFINSPYASITPTYYAVSQSDTGKNFSVYFQPNVKDLKVTITNVTPARPGFEFKMRITYRNKGTVTMNGNVNLLFDNAVNFIHSYPFQSSINANTINWNFSNLMPFESRNIDVFYNIPTSVSIGDFLTFISTVLPVVGDSVPSDNTDVLRQIVTGSYDPNEKEVSPENSISPQQILLNEKLIYTIHFQNTGTDTAFTVRIIDTLSPQLYIPSFEVLSASHHYSYSIKNQGIVEFVFENIFLPDSNTNESNSHGYIKYSILPNDTLVIGDSIQNKAYIYFDFNEPIVTNTTLTQVLNPINPVIDNVNDFILIYPNPSTEKFSIIINECKREGTDKNSTMFYVSICNIMGEEIFNSKYKAHNFPMTIDLSSQPSGVYIITAKTDYITYFQKIVKR